MTVGLNSSIKQNEFKRKKLNLVLVLDNSGSMSCCFRNENTNRKMKIANESCCELLKHLHPQDRFGMVRFNTHAVVVQPLEYIQSIDMNSLKTRILSISAGGGTNFVCGYRAALALYNETKLDHGEYDNRIIFLTDACPNQGMIDPDSLLNMIRHNSNNKQIYTSLIGIGLDFNTELVSNITKARGCNYFSIHSTKEFIQTMDEEFEYMVTPLVFNVSLKMISEGNCYSIKNVYGTGSETECKEMIEDGEIQKIYTLFPSKRSSDTGETKGGVILIELDNNHWCDDEKGVNVVMEVKYEDRDGRLFEGKHMVELSGIGHSANDMIEDDGANDYFDNTGIRKAILLTKYVNLIKEWIKEAKSDGNRSKWKGVFDDFACHFKAEMQAC
eukprot:256101_1